MPTRRATVTRLREAMAHEPPKGIPGLPDVVGLVESVRQVGSPLNFLAVVLALLFVFLIAAATLFGLPEGVRIGIVVVGLVAFAGLTSAVVWLAIRYPTFIFGEKTQFLYQQMLYGTNQMPRSISALQQLPARAVHVQGRGVRSGLS